METISRFMVSVSFFLAVIFSGQAMALPPSATPAVFSPINISGSPAQQKILRVTLSGLCQMGTLHTYLDSSGGLNYRSYYCTMDAGNPDVPTLLKGQNVVFNSRVKGQPIAGVVATAPTKTIEYMNIFNSNCVLSPTDPTEYNCDTATNRAKHLASAASPPPASLTGSEECDTYAGQTWTPANTMCVTPHASISDVEPIMFYGPNLPPSVPKPGPIVPRQMHAVVYGVHVTNDIYDDLLTAQVTSGDLPNTCVVGAAHTDACRPSMSKPQVTSVLSGNLTNFKQVDPALLNVGAGGSGIMTVCRRAAGSGMQAAANAYWMENICRNGSNGGFKNMVKATMSATYEVTENNSRGSMISCMQNAFDGVTKNYAMGAIGFNAIEEQPTSSKYRNAGGNAGDWDYVKINGIDPTVANAIAGTYDYWYERTIQWPIGTTGAALAAVTMILDYVSSPLVMVAAGWNGIAALPIRGYDWQSPADYPTMRGARDGNSCLPIRLEPAK